ncbi:nuclease-related domain-containing protein [Microbacterium aurum]|uniref:nuclease-related domain-containing protein n=1 Tax=Microbacterium aurum TaxID=36805 RepID=UPI0028E645AF|nr:nuclease-related domain-containing protein [Microbacterium aurum]
MPPDIPPQLPADSPAAVSHAFGTVAAASVIAECLRVQTDVAPRSAVARFIGRSPLSIDSRPWYLGALGELNVAARLESLGDGWTVLHSVPIGTRGADIDHVIVGAPGVFTINAKFHEGARVWVGSRRLLVNGQKTDHLRNTRYEVTRTQKLLSAAVGTEVPVRGAIVIVSAKQITIREQPDDVAVLEAQRLVRWLNNQKAVLNPTQVATIATAVREAATWSNEPTALPDTSGFAALRREVESAGRTRMVWGVAVLIAILGVSIPLVLDFYGRAVGG